MTQQALTNDSFLNLLNELSEELEMISTTNALTTNVDGDDDIENAVTKCQAIVDVMAAEFCTGKTKAKVGHDNTVAEN